MLSVVCFFLVLHSGLSTAAQPAVPLRITVFPVGQVPFNYPKPGIKHQAILGQVLRERLTAQPDIRVLSEAWSDALYADLFSGRRDVPEERVFAAYTAVVPLDALVAVRHDGKAISVLVFRSDGIRRHSIPIWESADFPEALASAADFLGKEFTLAPSNAAALRAAPTETPEVVEGIYLSRCQSWSAGRPAQEGPLRVLQPLWKLYPTNAAVDVEILKNLVGLHYSLASPRLQDTSRRFAAAGFDMAENALRWVLGTPMEESYDADIRLLRAVPRQDSSLLSTTAYVYEVGTEAKIEQGRATREAKTEAYIVVSSPPGRRVPRLHAR